MIFATTLVLLNILLVHGAQVSSYHDQNCEGDLSGNIQLDVNTCYGMTGGNQKSTQILNEAEDYTVHVWYGNMQCHDSANDNFNHNTCVNLEDDEFSVMVTRGDASIAAIKPQKTVKIENFF